MQYNPRSDQAMSIEKVAAECAAAIQRLCPTGKPGRIVWSEIEHRWVHNN
jgi:hypothetical protein